MNRLRSFDFPASEERRDTSLAVRWIVACVVLGIAFNALGIVRAMSGAF